MSIDSVRRDLGEDRGPAPGAIPQQRSAADAYLLPADKARGKRRLGHGDWKQRFSRPLSREAGGASSCSEAPPQLAADNRARFTAVVFSENLTNFPRPPREMYQGKLVRVRGTVSTFNDQPQIIVTRPDQIEVLDKLPPAESIESIDLGLPRGRPRL